MLFSLFGIVFGVAFFVVTQAQTSGFEKFFIRTILGTNGAIRISDKFQDTFGTVEKVDDKGDSEFYFHSREDAIYRKGVYQPEKIKAALVDFPEILGISEVIEDNAVLDTGSRRLAVSMHGIRWSDHTLTSDLDDKLVYGSSNDFISDKSGVLLGSRVAQRLNINFGDSLLLVGGTGNIHLKVAGIFETGVSQIDKNRIYIHYSQASSFLGKSNRASFFQLSLKDPDIATQLAVQLQSVLNHRVVSWQEREQVWLDVFKALRFSSGITVSTILLLSGLGMFNTFAIMVIEKTRDIAILRALGFSPADISAVFIWQGLILLFVGTLLGALFGALLTLGISHLPLRIRGIFSSDHFVVNWDPWHYIWAIMISAIVVLIACSIPARRASKIEPAKIIRETL